MHFRRKVKELQFKLNMSNALSNASEEELRITLELVRKEIDKRRRKKKCY